MVGVRVCVFGVMWTRGLKSLWVSTLCNVWKLYKVVSLAFVFGGVAIVVSGSSHPHMKSAFSHS